MDMLIPTPDQVGQILQMADLTNETEVLLKEWREMFYPECPWPEERQQPTQQPTPQGEQNDPPPRTDATDPPAGMPGMQPLAQAGTKASKEEPDKKYNLTTVATKPLPVENAKVVCDNVDMVLCKTKHNKRQLWLHSKANKEYTLQLWKFSLQDKR